MIDDLAQQLAALTAIPALTGLEEPMIAHMRRALEPAGTVEVDALGNVIAHLTHSQPHSVLPDVSQPGQPHGQDPTSPPRPATQGHAGATARQVPRVMIFAHMDELGMLVRRVEENGYLRVERVGGVPERVLAGQGVEVLARDGPRVEGVVGTKAHHYAGEDDKYRVVPVKGLYVDIGASSAAEVQSWGIAVGSPVVYRRAFIRRGSRVFSPALDDRAGCLVLLDLARRLAHGGATGADVYLVASVQEEFNLRGVLPAGRAINPHLAIAVDVCVATDTPDLADQVDVRLGRGPALGTYSFHGRGTLGGVIPNPKLFALMEETALRAGIGVQRNVFFGGLTDASFLQMEGAGIPCLDVGIPTRYTHCPLETCDLRDIQATATLLERFLVDLPQPLDLRRG